MKKAYIRAYGCQMNVYDADRMADILAENGFQPTAEAATADLIVLNTCHIREKAAEKVYSEIGRMRALKAAAKARGSVVQIAVAGCVAQAEGAEMLARAPAVDAVIGPQSYHRLPDILERARRGERVVDTEFPEEDKFDHLPQPGLARQGKGARGGPVSAFVTVQEGCDKFCTFCVVPYTRGVEVSRPAEKVVQEARHLVDRGAREIMLLGQNVNAYHGSGPEGQSWSLARLLLALAEIPDLARLRYTTSHPRDMGGDLIAAHRDCDKLMPYLHLPVQSGSDRVLAAMNRKHGRDEYLAIIERTRKARPDIAISGDFIVGFPGETDEDFSQTLDLVRRVGYAQAYSFKYSARPGTPAADRTDQVPDPIRAERLAELQSLLAEQQAAFNSQAMGQTLPVLLERAGRKPGQLSGRSPYLQAVQTELPESRLGDIVPIRIDRVGANSLSGSIVSNGESDGEPAEAVA